jgi:broad specificity phosphatase PhoE
VATHLIFLCAAATASSRIGAVPSDDESLDDGGRQKAAAIDRPRHAGGLIVSSLSRSAIETAAALGLAARTEPLLADLSFGTWAGRSISDLAQQYPGPLAEWLADPTQAMPGGEGMDELARRVGIWMDREAGSDATTLIISHASVMRAALSHALAMPLASAMRIDVAPLATLELSFNGQWRLQQLRRPL